MPQVFAAISFDLGFQGVYCRLSDAIEPMAGSGGVAGSSHSGLEQEQDRHLKARPLLRPGREELLTLRG